MNYRYNAFISYRHLDRDIQIVREIQKLLESYRSPCDGAYIKKGEKITRLFTDRSELPMSSDLGASIRNALAQSQFLLVIACPEYLQSRWCMEELRTFLQQNHNSTERILFIRTGGTPSCITDILSAAGVSTTANSFQEPLYIDVSEAQLRDALKRIKKEYLRLAAVLIGCGFDQLYQRHKRQRRRKLSAIISILLCLAAVVGFFFKSVNDKKILAENYRVIDQAIADIDVMLDSGNCVGVLMSMQQVHAHYEHQPFCAEYFAQRLDTRMYRASYISAYSPFACVPLPTQYSHISLSSDGEYLLAYDLISLKTAGQMKVYLYDAYLRQNSYHVLNIGSLQDAFLPDALAHKLYVDYEAERDVFIVEQRQDEQKHSGSAMGQRYTFSSDGNLLSAEELLCNEDDQPTERVRALYEAFIRADMRPGCMGADGVYTVFSDANGGFEPYAEAGAVYQVVYIPERLDRVDVIAEFSPHTPIHTVDDMYITPDEKYVIVKQTQGVYNDVLIVCDTSGKYPAVSLDMGGNIVDELVFYTDPQTEEFLLLVDLSQAGEDEKGSVVACSISRGSAERCERYEGMDLSCLAFGKQGYIYAVSGYSQIIAVATENMCLPDRLCGIVDTPSVHTAFTENALIEDADRFQIGSTAYLTPFAVDDLIIDPNHGRNHWYTPVLYSGVDVGIALKNTEGNVLTEFFDADSCGYYNAQERVFGLIDYTDPESSQLFRLYDLQELLDILDEAV